MCGEKSNHQPAPCRPIGSPPRVRGKVRHPGSNHPRPGITPACAGKRYWFSTGHILPWDHPRVCGEKPDSPGSWRKCRGSPPRVRGKATPRCILQQLRGITPACAGKSTVRREKYGAVRDHPRVCGEKQICSNITFTFWGSPPRVRGKVSAIFSPASGSRITPACAGKSRCANSGQ